MFVSKITACVFRRGAVPKSLWQILLSSFQKKWAFLLLQLTTLCRITMPVPSRHLCTRRSYMRRKVQICHMIDQIMTWRVYNHLCYKLIASVGWEILPLKYKFAQKDNFSHRKNNLPIGYLEYSMGIKELPKGN